jgi:hypothetical protein
MQPKQPIRRDVPYVSLSDAISKAGILWQKAKRGKIAVATAMTYLGHSPKSSHGEKVIGALGKYTLLDSEGSNENRQVWVSETAIRILLDQRDPSPERDALVRKCALAPKGNRLIWERYGADLPDDASVKAYLVLEQEFSEDAAKLLLSNYKATVAHARLDERGALGDITAHDEPADAPVASPKQPATGLVEAPVVPVHPTDRPEIPGPVCTFYLAIGKSGLIEFRKTGEWGESQQKLLRSLVAV